MSTIVTRAGKGSPLTNTEVDTNFTNLNTDKIQSGDTVATLDINGGTINNTAIGGATPAAGAFTTLSASSTVTLSGGTANGVAYLNGSNVVTTGSALTFDGNALFTSRTTDGTIFIARGTSTAQLLVGISSGNLYYDSSNGNATHYWNRNSVTAMYLANNTAGYSSLSIGTGAAGMVGKLTVQEDVDSTYYGNSASIILSNRNYGTNNTIAGGLFVSTYRDVVAQHVPAGIWFTRQNIGGVVVYADIVFGQSYPYNEAATMPTYRGSMQASTGNFYWGCANTVAKAGVGTGNGFFPVQMSIGGSNDDNLYIRRETSGGDYCLQTTSSGSNTGLIRLQPYGGTVVINNTENVSGLPLDVYGDMHVGVGSENRGIYFGPWGYTPSIRYNGDGNLDIAARGGYGITLRYETGSSTVLGYIDRYGNIITSGSAGLGSTGGFVQMLGPGYTASPSLWVGHASGVSAGNYYANFQYAGSSIGSITQSGTTGVNYVTNSDYRLKEDPQPIPDVIARFKKLKPYQYRWKSSGELDEGFFAHELAESCSNAVTGEKDAVNEDGSIKPQSVDYGRITPFLSAVMANMLDRIEQLEARLAQESK